MKQNKYDVSEIVGVPTISKVLYNLVERIQQRRKEWGYTQKELAMRAGVSYGSLRRFEEKGEISLSSLFKIAQTLNCLNDFDNLFATPHITNLKDYKND